MIVVSEKLSGPAIIRQDTRLANDCTGYLTIVSGVTMQLDGDLHGNLLVCGGATAIINGEVKGVVVNEGGEVRGSGRIRKLVELQTPRWV